MLPMRAWRIWFLGLAVVAAGCSSGNQEAIARHEAVRQSNLAMSKPIDANKDKLICVATVATIDVARIGTILDKHGLSYGKFEEGKSSGFVTSAANAVRARAAIRDDAKKRGYALLTKAGPTPNASRITMFAPANSPYAAIKVDGKYKALLLACARFHQWSDTKVVGDAKTGFSVILGPKSGVQAVIDIREDSLSRGYDYLVVYRK